MNIAYLLFFFLIVSFVLTWTWMSFSLLAMEEEITRLREEIERTQLIYASWRIAMRREIEEQDKAAA